jgi:hypothetical protein
LGDSVRASPFADRTGGFAADVILDGPPRRPFPHVAKLCP